MTIFINRTYPRRLRIRRRYDAYRCHANPRILHPNIVGVWVCGCGASDDIGRLS